MLTKDYPELFGDKSYHVKVDDMVQADVLNDGSHDVVMLVTPNYRQSATVLIYQIASDGSVSRVTEGLAPGPLQPISGDYLDSHTLGEAVDLTAGDKQNDPAARKILITTFFEKGMGGIVAYKNFFHADNRNSPPWYVDMSDMDSPLEGKDCSKFEFSKVEGVAAGQISGAGPDNYLIANVGSQFYVYLITGIKDKIFLNKKVWIVPAPKDFHNFMPGDPSPLSYETLDGKSKSLLIPELAKQ